MNVLENFDLFLLDMDGVIYVDDELISGSAEFINYLYNQGKKIIFLTNNPSRSVTEHVKKLKKIGIKAKTEQIITSTGSLCYYLKNKIRGITGKSAYVIGSKQFKNSISKTGINIVNPKDSFRPDYVIMGGHKNFNCSEVDIASRFIRNGAKLIASNRDPYYPSKYGFSPGTGALLSSIEVASGKKAITTGKPEKYIFQLCLKLTGVKKNRTVIIGDSLETDILGGINFGIYTVLTLSGVTGKKNLKQSTIKPNYVADEVFSLIP